jgi:hypothetical protein
MHNVVFFTVVSGRFLPGEISGLLKILFGRFYSANFVQICIFLQSSLCKDFIREIYVNHCFRGSF